YKNKLNHLIRIAKRKYYDTKFESAKNDLRTTWKLINEVINKRKSKSPLPSSLASEGKTITSPVENADKFCKYFTNIGPNLARAIRDLNFSFTHTAPLFSKLEILDIFQVNTLDTAKFMFRYHNNLLPPLFRNLFM
ncbi:unnamed protein product, partial [Porites lobata]